ncbi:hypothetical protein BDR22DRAFT_882949 [Usnea florida]
MSANEPGYNAARPLPSRQLLYQYELVNSPSQSIIAFRITFPKNGAFPPHRHGGASVVDGAVLNRVNDEPARVLTAGETWYEAPGCHHRTFDNHLTTEPTTVLATYVVDTEVVREGGLAALTIVDEEFRDVVASS